MTVVSLNWRALRGNFLQKEIESPPALVWKPVGAGVAVWDLTPVVCIVEGDTASADLPSGDGMTEVEWVLYSLGTHPAVWPWPVSVPAAPCDVFELLDLPADLVEQMDAARDGRYALWDGSL